MPEKIIQPGREARDLLALVRNGEPVENVRKLIGDAPERRAVLVAFDIACMRLSRNRRRICQRIKPQNVSSHLRNRISALMRAGWSKRQIRARLPVSWPLLQKIAREAKPAIYKRGCGRRLTPEMKEQLHAAVVAGRPPGEIRRKFAVSYTTIHAYRRAAGIGRKDN